MASWNNAGHGGRVCIAVVFVMIAAASRVQSIRPSDIDQNSKTRVGVRRFSRAVMSDLSGLQAPGGMNIANELCSDSDDQHSGCGESGQMCCNGQCADVSRSSQSCGACNNQCAYNRECCGGVCVDAHASDPFNCGACGNVCVDGVPCLFGMCGYSTGRVIP